MPTAACAQRLLLATDPDLVTLVLRTLYRAISGCLFQKSSRIGWQWGRVLAVKAHGIFLA